MKKQNILTASILFAVSGASTSVFAVPSVTEYEQATSAYEDAYVAGNFNARSGNQDQSSYDLDLSLDYEKVFSSAKRNTKIDFLGTGSAGKGSSAGDESTNTYSALGSVTVDNYFRPDSNAGFWYGKGSAEAQKSKDSVKTQATLGLGYGRVVNVTPMARSIRIVEELRNDGFLKSDPSTAVYTQIAQIIEKESEYRSKHGPADYEQYWVQDIQSALNASGTLKSGLNARAILKSYDVLTNESISVRKNGWLVRAGIGAVISDFDGNDGKPALELGAEYHRPISNQTQFSNEAIATATLKDDEDGYSLNNVMSLTHEVSDVIDWENSWSLSHIESDDNKPSTTNSLTSAFYYSLTNQLDLGVIGKLTDVDDRVNNNGNDKLDKSINIGVKYRLK